MNPTARSVARSETSTSVAGRLPDQLRMTHEFCHFRLIYTPCCHHLLCWVNPRLPNFCPECGRKILLQLRTDPSHIRHSDPRAELKVAELGQGLLGGYSARPEHQVEED